MSSNEEMGEASTEGQSIDVSCEEVGTVLPDTEQVHNNSKRPAKSHDENGTKSSIVHRVMEVLFVSAIVFVVLVLYVIVPTIAFISPPVNLKTVSVAGR